MERDFNNSVRCDSPSLKDSENDQSLVGKVKSIITPLSKWFRKQDDESQITRKRDEDDLEDDMLQMQPPSKRVKLPNDVLANNCNNTTASNKLPSNDISSIRNFTNFPEPVAGPSGIKCRKTLNTHTSYTTETLNGHKDSDSEDSTSGYSSVARIGSREQVCQSLESSKQPSPTQRTSATSNNRTLFPSSNTSVNRSLFTDRMMSPHMNTSLSSRRPSFNASTFGSPNFVDKTLSTKNIINSPFYSGKTVYGGASAYGRKLGRTELDLKSNLKNSIHIKPVNQQQDESNNLVLGKTARRILETLEQYSSPISDAKKIPVASKKAKGGLISKYVGANPYLVRETKGALHKELQVPSVTDLLKMKQKTRLQDSTEAVRQIAKSSKSDLNSESYKLAANEEEKEKHTGKMRTKISSVRHKAPAHVDTPISEVSLKPVSLPITTLPKFDIVVPPPATVVASKPPEKPAPAAVAPPPVTPAMVPKPQLTEHKQNKSTERSNIEYKFSDPLVIAENLKSIIAMNNFKFSEPLCKQIQDEVAGSKVTMNFKMPENKLPLLVPNKAKNNGDTLVKAAPVILKTGSVMDILGKKNESLAEKFKPAKDTWECNTCLIRNPCDKTKCAACETPRTKKPIENKMEFGSQFKMTQDKWECTTCLVRNSNIDTKCVSCTTPKPSSTASTNIPTASGFGDKFKPKTGTWECPVCMIQNKLELSKCAACEAANPNATTNAPGFGDKFKPATNTWECSSCMVRNKEEHNKCVACESPRNGTVKTSGGFGSSFKTKEDEWECSVCMVKNKNSMSKCQCCETAKPGCLSTEQKKSEEEKPISKFNFGIDKATAASFSFGVPPAAQQQLPKLDVQPASVFGEAAKSTASSSTVPTFSFGVPSNTEKKEPAKQEEKKATAVTNPLLRPEEKLPEKALPAAAGFKFGLPTPAATESKEQPKPQETPKTSSEASTTNTETKLMFKFSASPSTTTTLFGGNKADNQTPKSDAAAAPLMFSFGSKASSTPQTTTTSQPVAAKAQTQSTPVFSFGSTAAKSGTEGTTPVFGASLGTTTNATSSVVSFGTTAAVAGSDTLFGTARTGPAAAEVRPFQFGAASPASAAASSSTTSEPAQKAAMFQFGQSASSTSATSAPAATSAAAAPSGGFNFNPAASASAAPAAAPAPAFNFSAGTTQATPAFNFGQKATPTFNFGGSQPQQQQQQSSGGPDFKFGATSMSTPGGFNFSAAPATFDMNAKPTFNFTGGSLPSFTAQPAADASGAAAPRKIKRAVRRTQR